MLDAEVTYKLRGCEGRSPLLLGKLKRFLSTLVQFGSDIGPDTGDRVRALVLSLVTGALTVEEFHSSLQEATNFPLRPFVVPFLRAHLPLLQAQLAALARTAKQAPLQYLRQHEHVVLDPAFSPSEPSEIFHSEDHAQQQQPHPMKRRPSDRRPGSDQRSSPAAAPVTGCPRYVSSQQSALQPAAGLCQHRSPAACVCQCYLREVCAARR
ncbi:protein CBFA2T1-like [Schistocerca piceifrons]|uniref:protein CBFA2T1-like n=1 Tax=Schistocerca piceifrons TaxID=274613 RepID=UPI001F5F0772|nr:protein CBFA2T1-like [Schistocerca piceifrons]